MTSKHTLLFAERIFSVIFHEQDYHQALQTLTDMTVAEVGRDFNRAALFIIDAECDLVHAVAATGLPNRFLQYACNLPADGWGLSPAKLSSDINQEPRLACVREIEQSIVSALELPLTQNGQVLGVLALFSETPDLFDETVVNRLGPLVAAGGMALQTARMLQTAQNKAAEADALNQIAKAVNANLNLETILSIVADEISRLVPHKRASLALAIEHDPAHLRVRPLKGHLTNEQAASITVSIDGGGMGIAFSENRPYIAADLSQMQSVTLDEELCKSGIRSYICLPLRYGQQVIGVLNLGSDKPHAFNRHNLPLLKNIGEQLALALGNARLYAYSQQRVAELDTLNDIGRALAVTLDEEKLLTVIYQQIRRVLDTNNLYIALYDEAAEELHFAFQMHEGVRQVVKRRPFGNGLTEHIIKTGQSLFLRDPELDQLRPTGITPFGQRPRIWLGVPLTFDEQVIGVISVQNYSDPEAYDEERLRLLQAVANQAALALQNARLYQTQRQKAAEETAKRMILSAANQTPDLKKMLQAVLDEVLHVTQQQAGWILLSLTQEQGLEMVAWAGVSPDFVQAESEAAANCHICQDVLAKQIGCAVQPLSACPYLPPILLQEEGLAGHASVPIIHQGKAVGILTIAAHHGEVNPEADLPLLMAIGQEIGAVVMNAHLYQVVQQEQRKLAAILNDTTDLVLVLDEAERVMMLNNATQKLLKVRPTGLTGQPIEQLGVPQLSAALKNAKQNGSRVREITLDDGCVLYASFSPVQEVGWVIVMQDITTLKQLDRLRTEWVASVSHDLKNPLASIQLSADLLEKMGPLSEKQQRVLQRLKNGAQRLRTLVTDVLDLARLEAGPVPQVTAVSLPTLIHAAVAEIDVSAETKQHTIQVNLPPNLPPAAGDPALLLRVLVNLMSNAIKYTPEKGFITVAACAPTEEALQIAVTDTGSGISPSAIPHLFDRFYRVPGSEADAEGTGLGLNIVKTIVEKHHGRIWVESQPGSGSRFNFTLPTYQPS